MQYVDFGRTGLRVSRLGFGGIPVQRIDEPGTRAMLKAAHEAGINYIDTARAYTVSEEWIGQALEELGLRDEFILATKCRALTKAEMEAARAAEEEAAKAELEAAHAAEEEAAKAEPPKAEPVAAATAKAPAFDYAILKANVIKLATKFGDEGKKNAINLLASFNVTKADQAEPAVWPEMNEKFEAAIATLETPEVDEFA